MRERLKEAAAKNNRTMNAEIVDRLDRATTMTRLIEDLTRAEERLAEQANTERELRKQILLLEDQIAFMKAQAELGHPLVEESNERVGLAAQIVDALESTFGSKSDMKELLGAITRASDRLERIQAGLEPWPGPPSADAGGAAKSANAPKTVRRAKPTTRGLKPPKGPL